MYPSRVAICVLLCVISSAICEDTFFSGLKVMYRAFSQCEENELFTCLKLRAIKSVDRLLDQDEVNIVSGISFQKVADENVKKGDVGVPLDVLDDDKLPQESEKREEKVDELLHQRISRFLSTHSLKINLAQADPANEGRGEGGGLGGGKGGGLGGGKKGGGMLIIGAMMAGAMKAMALKSLALLAGKALLIAKMALVLASVIAISKLTHKKGSTTYEIVKHPKVHTSHTYSTSHEIIGHSGGGGDYGDFGGGGGGGGYDRRNGYIYGRSMKEPEDPHVMAYHAQMQHNTPVPENVTSSS